MDLPSICRTLKKSKSRAKIINDTFVSLFTTPCKLVCKGGIYHFCPWRHFLFTCSSISRHWEPFFQNRSRELFLPKASLPFNHVCVKRQTRICTTWPTSFPLTCRLRTFHYFYTELSSFTQFFIDKNFLSWFYLLIFYFEKFLNLKLMFAVCLIREA